MRKIIELNAMKFYAYHGVLQQETHVGNYFIVDMACSFPMDKACISDDIKDTISYTDVYNVIKTEMQRPSKLIEHLAERISGELKANFPHLSYLKIKIAKLNPPLEGEVYSASIVIEKTW